MRFSAPGGPVERCHGTRILTNLDMLGDLVGLPQGDGLSLARPSRAWFLVFLSFLTLTCFLLFLLCSWLCTVASFSWWSLSLRVQCVAAAAATIRAACVCDAITVDFGDIRIPTVLTLCATTWSGVGVLMWSCGIVAAVVSCWTSSTR